MQGGFVQTLRNLTTQATSPPASAPAASVDFGPARTYVLEYMAALVGTKSPAYRKMSEVSDLTGFRETLPLCHKVIAAVASPHQAAEMEAAVAQRLG